MLLATMETTRSLTDFQRNCEKALGSAFKGGGLSLTDRALAGQSETYIRASVRCTDIVVYIYENEAQFHRGGKRAGVYEHQDFDDADQLQKAFISGVLKAAHGS